MAFTRIYPEGYHGTIVANMLQGLDKSTNIYDKRKVQNTNLNKLHLTESLD